MITTQIVDEIIRADLVVADLTGGNPNVFYELAIRHAIRRPVIHLIQDGEPIPFDIATSRTIRINHQDLDSASSAREELGRQIKTVLENPDQSDNPITTTLDLKHLRESRDPERQLLAELMRMVAQLTAEAGKLRHDFDILEKLKAWTQLKERYERIERVLDSSIYDIDDVMGLLEQIDSKLS